MCLQNIEDSSKNKQEYRKALDAFINQIDPGSGSIDRLRMAIASCKAGEGLQEVRDLPIVDGWTSMSAECDRFSSATYRRGYEPFRRY